MVAIRNRLSGLAAPSVTVDVRAKFQTIDGFGAANAPQGLDATNADRFFTTSSGIGLTLMRLPFASNGPGPTPYFPESATFYADAALAAARGALVWAAPWTAMTASWKDNASLVQGHLLSAHFGDYASYLSGLQAALVANSGPTLYGLSAINEPDLADGQVAYESMQMSAADMVTLIKNNLGPSLAALSPRPLLIAPECANWDNAGTYLATLLADSVCASYIDVVATHQYSGTVAALTTAKKVWQTEMSDLGAFDASIANGLTLAGRVHSALVTGNVNAWHAWWTRGSQANGLGLIGQSSDDTITKRFWCLGNFSKFVRPGYVRVGVNGSVSGVSMSAFKDSASGGLVVVAINTNGSAQSFTGGFSGIITETLTPWRTSATEDLSSQAAIPVTNGVFEMNLPASSVTSFVGSGA